MISRLSLIAKMKSQILILKKINIYCILLSCFLIAFCISETCRAGMIPGRYILRYTNTTAPIGTSLDNFWKESHSFGIGKTIPKTTFVWLNLDYHYFPFKDDVSIPVEIFDDLENNSFSGNSCSVFTAMLELELLITEDSKSRVVYFSFGAGYLKRSATIYKSKSPHFPSAKITYGGAGAVSMAMGLDMQFRGGWGLMLEGKYLQANTFPSDTVLLILSLGITFTK